MFGSSPWGLVLVTAALMLVLLPIMHMEATFASDEGVYALEAQLLERGQWTFDYWAKGSDPHGTYFPLVGVAHTDKGYFPYIKHPLYPALLAGTERALPFSGGMHFLSLLGVVGAGFAAWRLADRLRPGAGFAGFLVAVLGPLLAHGFVLWAHAPAAALAGFVLVRAIRILDDGWTPVRAVSLAGLSAALALLRTEALLFALAVGAVMALLERRRSLVAALGSIACLPVAAGAASWIESRIVAAITGSGGDAVSTVLAGNTGSARWLAAVEAFFGDDLTSTEGVIGVALIVTTAVGTRGLVSNRPREAVFAFGLTGVLFLLRSTVTTHPIFGLLPAWPALVVGITALALLWRRFQRDDAWNLVALSAVGTMLAVMVSQYADGGGVSVGPRYLLSLAVPLAAMAAVGLTELWDLQQQNLRAAPGVALGGLLACSVLINIASVRVHKDDDALLIETIRSAQVETVITNVSWLPRLAWSTHDDLDWLLSPEENLSAALAVARQASRTEVVIARPLHDPSGPWTVTKLKLIGERWVEQGDAVVPSEKNRSAIQGEGSQT